jgi:histone H3/H4
MKIIAPIRRKRKRADGVEGTPAESTPAPEAESTPAPGAESTPAPKAESTPAPKAESTPDTRGFLRKSAVRRFLKKEFDFPLQIREAFFTAIEAKFAEDLRRSVTRARESKRNTLMAPDA